jgi:O-antigen ligase
MIRKSIATALQFSVVAFSLFALLLADNIWKTSPGLLGSITREIASIFYGPSTQWMAALCLAGYFLFFLILEQRLPSHGKWWRLGNANLWLVSLIALVLLSYAFAYPTTSNSTQVPVLLAGIVFGKGISTWIRWSNSQIEQRTTWLVNMLICMFACTALWQSEMTPEFQYHGLSRWSGVWDNPNLYGLLMGVGLILAVGQILQCLMSKVQSRKLQSTSKKLEVGKYISLILFLVGVVLCGIGLFKSYSRGAWLGTAGALGYLVWRAVQSPMFNVQSHWIYWLRKNLLLLLVALVSIGVLCFWHFRFSEARPVQRAFSAANANDFSWRNRVTAWDGALHMMRDRPFIGFGWGKAETVYDKKYCPLPESAAIEMNDYFMLGISAGVPALVCFVAYLALAYGRRSPGFSPASSVFVVCRGGSIVLLAGFWFDGGLFKWAIAPVFWILIELSRLEPITPLPAATIQEVASRHSKKEMWLRWAAWILAAVAGLQTIVYVGTPFLSINNKTLAIARKCLVPPKEINDFDFLSVSPIWQGIKLKILLEHVDLANYNRQLVNWQLDDKIYQDYVLSPVIEPSTINFQPSTSLNWRRPLWEEFYPRIRHESSPEDAAKIVVRHLRERVTIAAIQNPPRDISTIWSHKMTDAMGFQIIYVAALRSVGVPARLNASGQAEFWDGTQWQLAPLPVAVK